jgi:N-acetylmuramoyl-L-alanine amidase-like protein
MSYDFEPDVPDDLVFPRRVLKVAAFEGNLGGYGRPNVPRALVLHTPEEDADGIEVTPRWFQDPRARASTHYYADSDGDLYQMVSDADCAWAQGTHAGNRHWKGERGTLPPWNEGVTNNCRALSIEIEGRAATIGETLSEAQHRTVVRWLAHKSRQYDIPLDRTHVVGHEELATDKRDPGIALGTFPLDELIAEAHVARGRMAEVEPGGRMLLSPVLGRWQLVRLLVENQVRIDREAPDDAGRPRYAVTVKQAS